MRLVYEDRQVNDADGDECVGECSHYGACDDVGACVFRHCLRVPRLLLVLRLRRLCSLW